MIVRPAPKEHYAWLTERAGLVPSCEFRAIEAADESGRIVGMVGYDSWTPNGVFMSVALEDPQAVFALRRHAFRYPFVQESRNVAVAIVRSDNLRSQRLIEHLGFRMTYAVNDGWANGIDLLVYEMRRKDCRWIRGDA